MSQKFVVTNRVTSDKPTSVVIKIKKKDNNEKKLKSILLKISKTFAFLSDFDDTQWNLKINDVVVQNDDYQSFGELIANHSNIDIVQSNDAIASNSELTLIIHDNDNETKYTLNQRMNEWNHDTYTNILKFIGKSFNLNDEIRLYEDVQGERVDIDTIEDIQSVFEDGTKSIAHVYVYQNKAVTQHIKINLKEQSFKWTPLNPDSEDEEIWDGYYMNLLKTITEQFKLNGKSFDIKQIEDGNPEPMASGEDLMLTWQDLSESSDICAVICVVLQSESHPESMKPQNDDLKDWLSNAGQSQYYNVFVRNGYTDLRLFNNNLTNEDLKEIGIKSGDRKLILMQIKTSVSEELSNQRNMDMKANDDTSDDDPDYKENDEETKENDEECQVMTIERKLDDLGSKIASLDDNAKTECHGLLITILDIANKDKLKSEKHEFITKLIQETVTKNYGSQFVDCVNIFLNMIGYELTHENTLDGYLNEEMLKLVKSKVRFIEMSLQRPKVDIYRELSIVIPSKNEMKQHESGVNDNQFITFQLL